MYQNLQRHRVGLYEKALPNSLSWEEKLSVTKELGCHYGTNIENQSHQQENRTHPR